MYIFDICQHVYNFQIVFIYITIEVKHFILITIILCYSKNSVDVID